jgi:hypothetical protein
MSTDSGRGGEVQGVKHPDRICLVSQLGNLVPTGPADFGGLTGRSENSPGLTAAEHQSDNAPAHVLVDPGQRRRLDLEAGLLGDLATQSVSDALTQLQDATRRLLVIDAILPGRRYA